MTARRYHILALSLLALTALLSCKEESDTEMLEDSLCDPTAVYYFSGVVGETMECWNIGLNNYQVYHGWGSSIDPGVDTAYYWQPGLDQYPVPEDNKTLHLSVEVAYDINTCTSDQFHMTFQPGFFSFKPIHEDGTDGIEIYYRANGQNYSTRFGPQIDSFLECTAVTENLGNSVDEAINVSWKFRCKLYAQDGTFYKEIKIGKMRVSVLHVSGDK